MKQNKEKVRDFEARFLPQIESLYRTALYVLDSESDAQDLVQESFVRVYRSLHRCQFSPNCRVYLFKIMASALIDRYWPTLNLSTAISNADEIGGYSMYTRWVDRESIRESGRVPLSAISEDLVKKAVAKLPVDFRLVVVLSLLEGFSYQEIAAIVGTDLETVRSGLHHGRRLMKRELLDYVAREGNNSMTAGRVRSKELVWKSALG